LERAQGYPKLPNGRALTGQSHDYKRHGTTTLFAALEVATGKDHRGSFKTTSPRRVSRLHEQCHRGLSGSIDNLNTHKKNESWLMAHPNRAPD
jgi:hypothetical protein